jgi:hypothetical protein
MRKFSNITNYEVPGDPKPVKVDESTAKRIELKQRVIGMINGMLRVTSHGSVRPELMMPTSIEGQEMFAEAIIDMITNDGKKDAIKVLESLKQTNHDWATIDDKISELSEQTDSRMENKFAGLADRWGQDNDLLDVIADTQAKGMDPESLTEGIHCLSGMITSDTHQSIRESLEVIRAAYVREVR